MRLFHSEFWSTAIKQSSISHRNMNGDLRRTRQAPICRGACVAKKIVVLIKLTCKKKILQPDSIKGAALPRSFSGEKGDSYRLKLPADHIIRRKTRAESCRHEVASIFGIINPLRSLPSTSTGTAVVSGMQ